MEIFANKSSEQAYIMAIHFLKIDFSLLFNAMHVSLEVFLLKLLCNSGLAYMFFDFSLRVMRIAPICKLELIVEIK